MANFLLHIWSIRWRLIVVFFLSSMPFGLLVRSVNYSFILGLLHHNLDAKLDTMLIVLDGMVQDNPAAKTKSGVIEHLLMGLASRQTGMISTLIRRFGSGPTDDDQPFAGIWMPGAANSSIPGPDGKWLRSWFLPPALANAVSADLATEISFMEDANCRLMVRNGPDGAILVAGSPREKLQGKMRALLLFYSFTLVVGTLVIFPVTWWLITLSLRPIRTIGLIAKRITAGDLRARLDTTAMASELGTMAEALNEMLDRLDKQSQAQAAFTADISHELGNPVNLLILQTQMAWEAKSTPAELRETLQVCYKISKRMDRLRLSLLVLARADASLASSHQVIDLEPVVDSAVEAVEHLASAKEVSISFEARSLDLQGNADLLHQLLVNLLSNAIRHTPTGSTVTLIMEETVPKRQISLRVRDEGPGVNPLDVPHLFDRFFVGLSRKTRTFSGHGNSGTEGNGLGLAICKSIVDAHAGTIHYHTGPQGGAIFEVLLPVNT